MMEISKGRGQTKKRSNRLAVKCVEIDQTKTTNLSNNINILCKA